MAGLFLNTAHFYISTVYDDITHIHYHMLTTWSHTACPLLAACHTSANKLPPEFDKMLLKIIFKLTIFIALTIKRGNA